ncbi:MAG TPA: response regulator [Candidatus Binatia bacterium]|nr:response regulator [Candidatus Binatia bacterium]
MYCRLMPVMVDEAVILLAEDNEDDVAMMRRAFKKANFVNPLYVVENGEQAIAYLKGEGKYASREEYPLPSLLLLDLKMPRKNGFDVLEWIRQQNGLGSLRVVVLTSSDEIRDVNRAYQLGANSFLVKPLDFSEFVRMTEALKGYWIWLSRAPELSRPPRELKPDKAS